MRKLGVTREIGTGVIVRGWTQVTSLLVVIAAGRILDRHEFGVYAIASVFLTILNTIIYSGLYEYIIKTEDYEAAADTCFWMNFAFAVGGVFAMGLLAPLVAYFTRAPEIQPLILWLAPTALLAALTSWQEALILRRKKITAYYIVWFTTETVSTAITIGLFFLGWGVYALVACRYVQLVLTGVGYLLLMSSLPCFAWNTVEARSAFAFASRLYGSRLIAIISNFSADLIIGTLTNPAAAGAYRLASRMVFGVSEIWFQPIKTIAWVRFSSAVRDRVGFGHEWPALMMVLSMVAWPTLGGVAVLSHQLTYTVLGSGWLVAAPVVTVLAIGKASELFEVFLDPLLATSGQQHRLLQIRTAASVVAVVGFFSLARFGATMAAWAQALTYLSLAAVTIRVGVKQTNVTIRTLISTLLPGVMTTIITMAAAAAAAGFTSRTGLAPIAEFACDVAAGALAWAFMAGIVFRRRALAVVLTVKDRSTQASLA